MEDVSDEMGGVTDGKVLAFGGVEVQLPIFGPERRFRWAMSLTSSA